MHSGRSLINFSKRYRMSQFSACSFTSYSRCSAHSIPSQHSRLISFTAPIPSWMDSIKGFFTGKKGHTEYGVEVESFTMTRFADGLKKESISGEARLADKFKKLEEIIRYLSGFDATGENLQTSQKEEAAKHCNCTLAEVEIVLAQFTWGREAMKKVQKLEEEGKPAPKSFDEVEKLMEVTPIDIAKSNFAKSLGLSGNNLCPCGSRKRFKRCCGEGWKV